MTLALGALAGDRLRRDSAPVPHGRRYRPRPATPGGMSRSGDIQTRRRLCLVPYYMERRKLRRVHGDFGKTAGKRRGRRLKQTNAAITYKSNHQTERRNSLAVYLSGFYVHNTTIVPVALTAWSASAAALRKGET